VVTAAIFLFRRWCFTKENDLEKAEKTNPDSTWELRGLTFCKKKTHSREKWSSNKSFQIFVTGETNRNVSAPAGPEVLRQQISE
jgi:hypothetical protein